MTFLFWTPAALYAIAIFALSHQSNPPGAGAAPDYVLHFLEYGLFSLTILFGFTRGFRRQLTFSIALSSWLIATIYGAIDEFHQLFIPNRFASWSDILADTLGAFFIVAFTSLIIKYFGRVDR